MAHCTSLFLLFGRQLSRGGNTSEVWVEVRLPEGGAYPCLRDAYQSGLIANHVESKVAEALGQGLQPSAHAIALAGLSSLTHLVDKSVNCCNSQQSASAVTSCTDCWFEGSSAEAEYAGLLDGYGYLEYTGVSVTVDTLETPYTGALKSDYGITLSGPGIHLSLTEETNNFLNGGLLPLGIFSRRVDVYSYGASDCELLDQLLQTSSAVKLDSTGLAYEEKIIILNFGGQPRVFYKFAVGQGYGPGGAAFKGGPPDSRQAVFFPAIAGWIMKKALMAGTGVMMHVGITVAFEKWFGDYETWGEAWDNSSFTAWELFYAAVSGALAEHVVLDFFGSIIDGMMSYVLNTPSSSFSWEGFFSGTVTGMKNGVLGLLTGRFLGDLSDKGKAIFKKYAPNINLTPGGPGGGDPWYRVLKELVQMSPTFVAKRGTFGVWKVIKKRNLPSSTDSDILGAVSDLASYRAISPNQLFDFVNDIDPTLIGKWKTNGKINKSQLLGISYEGQVKQKLIAQPGFKISGREFDGKYSSGGDEIWYEAKYLNFWGNTALNDVNTWKSKFGQLKSIASQNGKSFEVITEGQIPQVFKSYFNANGILYKENFF